ncbi:MAG: hydrogenobyrinic acid a,c-diamide synthase (glutamine-hydrolyzing) [Chloroflexi bacterium]|nr:hydrogenobyrinic acid a,c-diamide synthase (glutamine-hydrolyzing) [Chloroflexota bacterium]
MSSISNQQSAISNAPWPPRLVIAAPQGRSGKTIVSLGLCAAFAARGLAVQPFKKGPDYIDPSWLTAAARRPCRNLDLFLMSPDALVASFESASQGVDLAFIEGAMGLYDGIDLEGSGSTAELARLLECPIILVVNTARMTRSVAAMVAGYQRFEADVNIAGVILNSVSRPRHERMLIAAVERYCGLPVLGSFPRDPDLSIAERYLGLTPQVEEEQAAAIIERIRAAAASHLDLEGVLKVARAAPPKDTCRGEGSRPPTAPNRARIGVIRDRAFSFYYPENLEALEAAGAGLVFIDSMRDKRLPQVDGLYIGGGFPERFMAEIEANDGLRRDIGGAIEDGLPAYAECGGLMYLCRSIQWHGEKREMVGVFPYDVELLEKPVGHGYAEVEVVGDNPLFPVGSRLRGHEFHHSRLALPADAPFAYRVLRGTGIDGQGDGLLYRNAFASYIHLHAVGAPQWALAFVSLAAVHRERSVAAAGEGSGAKMA